MIKKEEIRGSQYFSLGLLCFGGLGLEFVVIILDKLIWGEKFSSKFFENPWYINITHWIIITIIWVSIVVCMSAWLKNKNAFNEMFNFLFNKKAFIYLIAAIIGSIFLAIFENAIESSTLPQILGEYNKFVARYNDKGLIVSIFQNIYYVAESAIVLMLLAFMQKAGEKKFKNKYIPYGGIGLMLTWGLGHFTKGIFGMLWITMFALIAGELFVVNKKSIWVTFIFILLVFLI